MISSSEIHGNESKTVSKSVDWTMDAYTRVLQSILFQERKDEFFPSVTEIMMQWKIFSTALECIEGTLLEKKDEKKEKEEKTEKKDEKKEKEEKKERKIVYGARSGCTLFLTYDDEISLRTYTVGSSIKSIVENK
jgi:hypothetical protein